MKFVPNKVSIAVSKTALRASKYSPQILFGAGVIGVGATAVLAAKATLQLEDILDAARNDSIKVDALDSERFTDEQKTQTKIYVKVKTAGRIAKLYLPTLIVGSLSIAALTGSHRILTKRNAGLTAAYAALDKGFREYRSRVVEEIGEERELHIRSGVTKQKVQVVDEATGKKTVVEKNVQTGSPYSEFARLFADQTTPLWSARTELNYVVLRGIQTQLNMNLQANGYVMLNDVYKELGFEPTSIGQTVGWTYNSEHGDQAIDFGIFGNDMEARDYIEGRTDGAIWLDFNVDGLVFDKIDKINRGKGR